MIHLCQDSIVFLSGTSVNFESDHEKKKEFGINCIIPYLTSFNSGWPIEMKCFRFAEGSPDTTERSNHCRKSDRQLFETTN